MSIRVALVEDNSTLLTELQNQLGSACGFVCVAGCRNAASALHVIPAAAPDVVVIDIYLPDRSGVELVGELRAALPKAQMLMLTVEEDYEVIFQALVAGATGYLVKKSSAGRLAECIRELHEGGAPMSASIARKVVRAFQQFGRAADELDNLSHRQQEVLEFLSRGLRYKEIAAKLDISIHTVRNHIHSIYELLRVRTRKEAVKKLRLRSAK